MADLKDSPCSKCGEFGRRKARAWSSTQGEKLFCHDDDQEISCYQSMRGRYFDESNSR